VFNSQDIANTAWAYATVGVDAPQLFSAIATAAQRRLGEFNPQSIANTSWAFATAGADAPRLFAAIADTASSNLSAFNPQNLANTAWAFATAREDAPRLFSAIAIAAQPRLGEFNAQDLANTAWAFALVDWKEPQLFVALAPASDDLLESKSDKYLTQLYFVALHFLLEWPDRSFALSHCHLRLQSAYRRGEPRPSQLQRDVAAALARVGWTHVFEYVTAEGLSLDMAQPSAMRAIEVDGPSHYLTTAAAPRYVENGATRLKSRLLRGLDWDLVRVPFYEWGRLGGEAVAEEAYLRAKLGGS